MRIRKFEARTVQQAINKAKTELGEDALILHTRSFPGRFFGLLGKPRVEVTAAVEDRKTRFGSKPLISSLSDSGLSPAAERPAPSSSTRLNPGTGTGTPAEVMAQDFLTRIQQIREAERVDRPPAAATSVTGNRSEQDGIQTITTATPTVDAARFENLEIRIERLANTMDRLLSLGGPLGQIGILTEVPDAWHPAMKRLMESNLSEKALNLISRKLQSVPHPGKDLESKVLREIVAGLVRVFPAVSRPRTGQRVIALIGPTGVGKTTTLAKLASGLVVASEEPTKVGLITVDTYRLAAVDQLETYAKILNLDLQVVFGPEEMKGALDKCRQADVVFIDTAGRSPRDDTQMEELKEFLDKVPDCEKFLVLSSTMNDRYLLEAVERFRITPIDSLIVTKLDETRNDAAPLNMHLLTGIPLSYLTTGQNVPEDIECVEAGKLAEKILGQTQERVEEEALDSPEPSEAAVV